MKASPKKIQNALLTQSPQRHAPAGHKKANVNPITKHGVAATASEYARMLGVSSKTNRMMANTMAAVPSAPTYADSGNDRRELLSDTAVILIAPRVSSSSGAPRTSPA